MLRLGRRRSELDKFVPGQRVLESGVYRVHHDSHRLMHQASLKAGEIFPCCKQCGRNISFELARRLRDEEILPFSESSLFKQCGELAEGQSA
jgi:hypothetical protein